MKTDTKRRSPTFSERIACFCEVNFPKNRDYHGTDADHLPVIPGNDFPPETSYGTNSRNNTFSRGHAG